HSKSALLLPMVLFLFRSRLVPVDDFVDEFQNLERHLLSALGERDQEVCSGNIWGRNLLVKVDFPVEILRWFLHKELHILVRLAQYGEKNVRNEVVDMGIKRLPCRRRLDTRE